MNKRRSLAKWLTVIFLLIFSVSLPVYLLQTRAEQVFAVGQTKTIEIKEPTIFVPGTNGKETRFDGLLDKLAGSASVLKVVVATDGSVASTGTLSADSLHPMIVVTFADSSNKTLSLQGKWYQQALTYIQKQYQFNSYNYFGHSNGGLVITSYLEKFQAASDPKVRKIITAGTPFNDVSEKYNRMSSTATTVKEVSGLLENYLVGTENIPASLEILNIAGDVNHSASDGTVPVQSVFAGRMIYQTQVSSYQELVVTTGKADHTSLVENIEVIKAINKFFYGE